MRSTRHRNSVAPLNKWERAAILRTSLPLFFCSLKLLVLFFSIFGSIKFSTLFQIILHLMHQNQTKQQSFSIDVAVAFTGLERTCLFCKWQKKNSVDQCDVVSDSSGVGTSNSGSGGSYDATPSDHSTPIGVAGVGAGAGGASQLNVVLPGMTVVCTEPYASKEPGHLHLMPGDIIEGGSTRFQLPFFLIDLGVFDFFISLKRGLLKSSWWPEHCFFLFHFFINLFHPRMI